MTSQNVPSQNVTRQNVTRQTVTSQNVTKQNVTGKTELGKMLLSRLHIYNEDDFRFKFWVILSRDTHKNRSLLNKLVKNQSLNKTVFFVLLILSPTTEVNCVFRINELCIASKSLDEPFKEDEQHVVINFQMEPKLIRLN